MCFVIEFLKNEGFIFNGYVDIFDVGLMVEVKIENIVIICNVKIFKVEIGES